MATLVNLKPSDAGIWGPVDGCHGSPLMPKVHIDNEHRKNGIAGHKLASQMISSFARANVNFPSEGLIGTLDESGVLITDTMYSSALLYAEDVYLTMQRHKCFNTHTEESITCEYIDHNNYGICDNWLFIEEKQILYVWEYKTGFTPVDAFENYQLINCTAGIIESLGRKINNDQHLKVLLIVIQPSAFKKSGPKDIWELKGSDLRPYINILKSSAELTRSDNPKLRAGSRCKKCSSKTKCPAFNKSVLSTFDYSCSLSNQDISDEALGLHLSILRQAKENLSKCVDNIEEIVKQKLKSGVKIPGQILHESRSKQIWDRSISEVKHLGELFDCSVTKETLKTPKQVIDEGKIDKCLVDSYSIIKPGSLSVKESNLKDARKVFTL